MSLNQVAISGNLTRDAEHRATSGGTSTLSFSVAVNDRRKNAQTGEWEDVPNFIDCVMFGRRADSLQPYLRKGVKVSVAGKLRWSSWKDRDTGKSRSKVEVIADELEFMTGRNENAARASESPQPTLPVQDAGMYDEDIPF